MKTDETARDRDTAARLRTAANLIEAAMRQLDLRSTDCGECGRSMAANLSHKDAYDALSPTPAKLRKWAAVVEAGRVKRNEHRPRMPRQRWEAGGHREEVTDGK